MSQLGILIFLGGQVVAAPFYVWGAKRYARRQRASGVIVACHRPDEDGPTVATLRLNTGENKEMKFSNQVLIGLRYDLVVQENGTIVEDSWVPYFAVPIFIASGTVPLLFAV
jgi:hypothetical protein